LENLLEIGSAPQIVIERRQIDEAEFLRRDAELKAAREQNGIETGRLWLSARGILTSAQYKALMEKSGRHPLTIAGFIRQAQKADGVVVAAPRQRALTAVTVRLKTLQEVLDMLKEADSVEQAMEAIRGELNEAA